jgi:hypothetical protein
LLRNTVKCQSVKSFCSGGDLGIVTQNRSFFIMIVLLNHFNTVLSRPTLKINLVPSPFLEGSDFSTRGKCVLSIVRCTSCRTSVGVASSGYGITSYSWSLRPMSRLKCRQSLLGKMKGNDVYCTVYVVILVISFSHSIQHDKQHTVLCIIMMYHV